MINSTQNTFFNTAVAPVVNSIYAAIMPAELAALYLPVNGSTVVTAGAAPITIAQDRLLIACSGKIVTNAGTFTTGAVSLYTLGLDGNWRAATSAVTLTASGTFWFSFAPGNSAGSFTVNGDGLPFYGLGIVFTTAVTGGGLVTYMEAKSKTDLIDPAMVNLVRALPLKQ